MAQAQSPPGRLTIDDIAFGGKGVARHEGKVVFVPFTIPGEEVSGRIVKQKKNFAEAALLAVEKSSPNRVEPRCPYFQRCGGCSYQHIDYARQLEIKSRQVAQTLQRVGKLRDVPMHPIIASPQAYGYRNRIRVHVEDGVVGFYAQDRHELIDIQSCAIASEKVNEALRDLRARSVRDGDYTLAESGGGRVFSQINNEVAREMLNLVGRLVRREQSLLIDAYCGAGMFAKFLAPHFQKVIGIEENEFAVERARRNADAKETYLAGDVASHLDSLFVAARPAADDVDSRSAGDRHFGACLRLDPRGVAHRDFLCLVQSGDTGARPCHSLPHLRGRVGDAARHVPADRRDRSGRASRRRLKMRATWCLECQ